MSKILTAFLFITFSLATIIGINKYFEKSIEDTQNLSSLEINKIIEENPTASGFYAGTNERDTDNEYLINTSDTKIEDDESFNFLKD